MQRVSDALGMIVNDRGYRGNWARRYCTTVVVVSRVSIGDCDWDWDCAPVDSSRVESRGMAIRMSMPTRMYTRRTCLFDVCVVGPFVLCCVNCCCVCRAAMRSCLCACAVLCCAVCLTVQSTQEMRRPGVTQTNTTTTTRGWRRRQTLSGERDHLAGEFSKEEQRRETPSQRDSRWCEEKFVHVCDANARAKRMKQQCDWGE